MRRAMVVVLLLCLSCEKAARQRNQTPVVVSLSPPVITTADAAVAASAPDAGPVVEPLPWGHKGRKVVGCHAGPRRRGLPEPPPAGFVVQYVGQSGPYVRGVRLFGDGRTQYAVKDSMAEALWVQGIPVSLAQVAALEDAVKRARLGDLDPSIDLDVPRQTDQTSVSIQAAEAGAVRSIRMDGDCQPPELRGLLWRLRRLEEGIRPPRRQ